MSAEEAKKEYLLKDYYLFNAKDEKEILSWAKGKTEFSGIERFDSAETKRFKINNKDLLVLLATPPVATARMTIFIYVGDEDGWSLLLFRFTNSAEVKIHANKKAKQLEFRSKAGKLLLILPVENIEIAPVKEEQ